MRLHSSPPERNENLGGWLSRVATNLAYNYLRGERRRRDREYRGAADRSESESLGLETPDQLVECLTVRAVLDRIPERDRLALLLRFSGYSYEEMGEILGIRKGSVGTILARAQARFRDEYRSEEGREDELLRSGRTSGLSGR